MTDKLKGVSHYKYFLQLADNIVTFKRFYIKLTTILVGCPLLSGNLPKI